MTTITVKTATRKEANQIIRQLSVSDMSATFSDDMDTVTTSELTATVLCNNTVEITSKYYSESQLRQMFL